MWWLDRDLSRTFSVVSGESPLRLLTLSSFIGGGTDLTEGPQEPRGPQPAARGSGGPLLLPPRRVGAALSGVYPHSLQSLTSPLPFTALPLGSLNLVQNQSFNNTIKVQSSPQ